MTVRFAFDCRPASDHFPGIGRYVSNLTSAAADQLTEDEQLSLIVNPAAAGRWPLPLNHPRVEVVESGLSLFGPGQHWGIPRLLRRLNIDLYHAPYYLMPWLVGRPTVLTCYDFIPQLFPETTSPRARRWFAAAHRLAWQRADHVIAISEATRQDADRFYGPHRKPVTVIPLAPDPRFKPAGAEERADLRRQMALPDRFVLYLGINKPHKNLVRLVEAWSRVESQATLVIAGAWDERYPQARDAVNELGLDRRVQFLGPIEDAHLPALYSAAELFVFPSFCEGFGLPVIEALACGTPVACSYVSSLPEVGGLAAVYFNPHDTSDIAATMQRLLDRPETRAELSQKGLAHAVHFTWEAVGKKTVKVYRQLVLNG